MKADAFENVKNQIGFCGIWCGSCVVGNGALKELTRRYEKVAEKYGLEEWAPKGFDFNEFKKGLVSISEISPCPGCLKGGGRDDCEIRSCASRRQLADCCSCDEFMACKNSEILKKMREGARDAGLLVKDKNVARRKFLDEGIDKLKEKFPNCILLCETP